MNCLRSYPRNSPQAAARIVVLAMLADGQLQPAELATLEAVAAHEQLGLSRQEWQDITHDFCTDLLASAIAETDCLIDAGMIAGLFAEIDDPTLQSLVLRLCTAVVNADGQVHSSEYIVLLATIDHWGLYPGGVGFLGRPELVELMRRESSDECMSEPTI